jgi:prepilin-type processing-associated H-X9-DG protein
MQSNRFTLKELVILVIIVIIAALVVLPYLTYDTHAGPRRRINCAGNLKQIGLGLLMYSGNNDGSFPIASVYGAPNFEPLNTLDILYDGKVYACPSARKPLTLARQSNYRYAGSGLKDDNDSATAITIAFDRSGNHPNNEWMNALFIDGHAEGARPDGNKQPNGWNVNN